MKQESPVIHAGECQLYNGEDNIRLTNNETVELNPEISQNNVIWATNSGEDFRYYPTNYQIQTINIENHINADFTSESHLLTPTLDFNLNRFQNTDIPGTYLYVGETESQEIRDNFPNFTEEGLAFKVSKDPSDELIPLYSFQSLVIPGTYLYVGEAEREAINRDFADSFVEEELAFYVYGVGTGRGTEFIRFQNSDRPGTYLYATGDEANNIRDNFPNFVEEGAAFEVGI